LVRIDFSGSGDLRLESNGARVLGQNLVTACRSCIENCSSLKVHEISFNEQEHAKKSKSIVLPSTGKSSKALKVIESEEESPDGDSDEDPADMKAMLSNML